MSGALPLVVVIAAGIITIIGAIAAIVKIVIPLSKAITDFREKVAPNVQYMPLLVDISSVLPTLRSIEAEFKGDSGSTLKDAMDRVERQGRENAAAAAASLAAATEFARINRESITQLQAAMLSVRELASDDRQLAREDREQILGAVRSLARVEASGSRTEASGERVEASGVRTEASGLRREVAAELVKDELAATQKRADDVHDDDAPGTAADAAALPPEEP